MKKSLKSAFELVVTLVLFGGLLFMDHLGTALQWLLVAACIAGLGVAVVRWWRNPFLPAGQYPTYFNRRVRRGRRQR